MVIYAVESPTTFRSIAAYYLLIPSVLLSRNAALYWSHFPNL
jgi:hypothetical protein